MLNLQTAGPIVFGICLVAVGAVCLTSARRVQERMLSIAGTPRTRLASWSLGLARSQTAVRSIRVSGLLALVMGVLLCVLPFVSRT